jgi:hypothetical protein
MDRITHQSPRQRGYGPTSSLRNDSLKHTRKQERGREESNQEAKHTGFGGPSGQEGRTVRTGHADRPACCRGLSAHTPRTIRPFAADRPKKQTEPPETTPNNGPSAGSTRTVRQAPADRPPAAVDCPKPCPTKTQREAEQEHEEHGKNSHVADCPPPARPRKSTSPMHHGMSQTVEAVKFGDMICVNQRCYTPKISSPNSLHHRESRIL